MRKLNRTTPKIEKNLKFSFLALSKFTATANILVAIDKFLKTRIIIKWKDQNDRIYGFEAYW
jgi:hypothetical protein